MRRPIAVALLVAAAAGCVSLRDAAPLSARIGDDVELRGIVVGEAKRGLAVDVDGETVFLVDPRAAAADRVAGRRVLVAGRLQHASGEGVACAPPDECAATVPAHFFIDAATVRGER